MHKTKHLYFMYL